MRDRTQCYMEPLLMSDDAHERTDFRSRESMSSSMSEVVVDVIRRSELETTAAFADRRALYCLRTAVPQWLFLRPSSCQTVVV